MTVRSKAIQWSELQKIIDTNKLDTLGRSVEQEEVYRNFKARLKANNWNLTTNLLVNSLHWLPLHYDTTVNGEVALRDIKCEDPRPFASEADTIIVPNNFPYYYAEPVEHVCVWVKFPMEPDPTSEIGDISPATKRMIEKYVVETFCRGLGISRSDVVWWKNYTALQSIRVLPHIHVAIRLNARPELREDVRRLYGTSGSLFDYSESKF